MINYVHEHARQVLKIPHRAVLATVGSAGVQASEFPCEAVDLGVYLVLPRTSDHLFNLEQDSRVALHTDQWELTGNGRVLEPQEKRPEIELIRHTRESWCVLVKVVPSQIQVLRTEGWGAAETIDLTSFQ